MRQVLADFTYIGVSGMVGGVFYGLFSLYVIQTPREYGDVAVIALSGLFGSFTSIFATILANSNISDTVNLQRSLATALLIGFGWEPVLIGSYNKLQSDFDIARSDAVQSARHAREIADENRYEESAVKLSESIKKINDLDPEEPSLLYRDLLLSAIGEVMACVPEKPTDTGMVEEVREFPDPPAPKIRRKQEEERGALLRSYTISQNREARERLMKLRFSPPTSRVEGDGSDFFP